MLLAAILLSQVSAAGYGQRVLLVALMGLLPGLQAELPNWNWYGFPASYTMAQLTVHLVGFAIGGLILAKVVKPVRPGDGSPPALLAPNAVKAS